MPRVGLAVLRAIVVEDSDGIAGRLDEAMQQSVDAYRDPWQEHRQPVTEGQFRAYEQVAVFRARGGGLIDGVQVVCPLHNHAFRLADGYCTTGQGSVQTYQVAVEDGDVVLRL
ncbi:MAG: Rieske (2Fe-2S) protein [Pseudonocardiaceae bacterium]